MEGGVMAPPASRKDFRDVDAVRAYLMSLSKEELVDRVLKSESGKISKRVAAAEVARWVTWLILASVGGLILLFVQFGAMIYASEGYAFLVTAAGCGFFAMFVAIAIRYRNYLRVKYGV